MSTHDLKPVLPKSGQLMIEDIEGLHMCKPRLIPLRSFTLIKLEKMQQEAFKLQSSEKAKEEK